MFLRCKNLKSPTVIVHFSLSSPDKQSVGAGRLPGCQCRVSAGSVALYPLNRFRHCHLHLCYRCPYLLSVWETTLKTNASLFPLIYCSNNPPWIIVTQTAALYMHTVHSPTLVINTVQAFNWNHILFIFSVSSWQSKHYWQHKMHSNRRRCSP